jgi:hypothetical protein
MRLECGPCIFRTDAVAMEKNPACSNRLLSCNENRDQSGHLNPVAMPCTQNRSYTCLGYRYWYAYALPCAEGTSWIFIDWAIDHFDLRIQVERLTIGKLPGQTPFSCLAFVSAAAEFGFLYDGMN